MNAPPPPGWYPDQADPRYVRWWDGRQWTQQVQPARPPQQRPAPPQNDASAIELALGGTGDAASVRDQVQRHAGGPAGGGGGTLFSEPVLVINQQAKLVEISNEFGIFDQHGRQLGSCVQYGQNAAQKAFRFLSKADSLLTVKLQIKDAHGNPVLLLHRPAATMFKPAIHVQRPDGAEIGTIKLANFWGKARLNFEVGGQVCGAMIAENLRGWDLRLVDHQEQQIGQISKSWEGLAKAVFTTADNYVLQIFRPLQDPLLSMVIASAMAFDTAFKQR
ncbi:phospholipid scramblase-related protein [Saccharopolyspora taberi]|uniref:Phospholipid scramblase-related protein n=1 Tax=Saccharopolyspora taberi TaxID=60895 RepID=A0ABN3VC55_9PSEU